MLVTEAAEADDLVVGVGECVEAVVGGVDGEVVLARVVGLSGNRSKLWASLERLSTFGLLTFAATDLVTIRLYMPPLTARQLAMLPDDLAVTYRTLALAPSPSPDSRESRLVESGSGGALVGPVRRPVGKSVRRWLGPMSAYHLIPTAPSRR